VEYYDCIKDPIKNYFLEKMQNTLVSKEALIILMKTNLEENNIEKEIDVESLRSFDDIFVWEEKPKYSFKKNYPIELIDKMEKYKNLKVFINI